MGRIIYPIYEMENNSFMFETTSQRRMIIARIGQMGHQNTQIVGPQTALFFIFGSPKGEDQG